MLKSPISSTIISMGLPILLYRQAYNSIQYYECQYSLSIMIIKASNYAFRYVSELYGINVDKLIQSLRPCTSQNVKTICFQTNIHLEINIVSQFNVCFVTQCRHLINIYSYLQIITSFIRVKSRNQTLHFKLVEVVSLSPIMQQLSLLYSILESTTNL